MQQEEDHPSPELSALEKARRFGCATFDPIATGSPDQASEAFARAALVIESSPISIGLIQAIQNKNINHYKPWER